MIHQEIWQWRDNPDFSQHVWGPEPHEEDTWIHAAYRCDSAGALNVFPLWVEAKHKKPEPATVSFAHAMAQSRWEHDDAWSRAAMCSLYCPSNGIPAPITDRHLPDQVEDVLDLSGGYLLWGFQFDALCSMAGICQQTSRSLRKGFNTRLAKTWRESEAHTIGGRISLRLIIDSRMHSFIRHQPFMKSPIFTPP